VSLWSFAVALPVFITRLAELSPDTTNGRPLYNGGSPWLGDERSLEVKNLNERFTNNHWEIWRLF
jgi:hypothetical protein